MRLFRTTVELRAAIAESRPRSRVGFVPTMGALHEGHLALFRAARECDLVVASVFVNPRQFDDAGDLAAYPRNEPRDAALAESAGVDLLFVPGDQEIYRHDHATVITVAGPAVGLEGDHRPRHFDGVATVCLCLFNIVAPDVVYLGQKDAQQVAVLRQLVRDVHLAVELRVVPTVREHDGLALSSRNVRLTTDERRRASAIPRALRAAADAFRRGRDPVEAARGALGDLQIDYVSIAQFDGRPTLAVAVRIGRTRLIDNVPLDHPAQAGIDVDLGHE